MKKLFSLALVLTMMVGIISLNSTASAAPNDRANERADKPVCMIPNGGDADNNGYGDIGVQVVCNYTSVYAYDANGDWILDLGDGRIQGTVTSVDELDQNTLSRCNYQVHTQGSFDNDPFLDSGVISNMIHCSGPNGTTTFHYQIVHNTHPAYTGELIPEYGGEWEYHVLTISGEGNIARVPAAASVN